MNINSHPQYSATHKTWNVNNSRKINTVQKMQKNIFGRNTKLYYTGVNQNLLLKSRCLIASWNEESRWKEVGVLGAGSGAMREPFRSSGLGWEYQAHSGGSSHTTDFAVPWLGLLGTISLPSLDTPGFELSGLLSFFRGNPISTTLSPSCQQLVATTVFTLGYWPLLGLQPVH